MKCQKCGQNEARFFYSTVVDGQVLETYLCASCALSVGNDLLNLLHIGKMLEEVKPVYNGNRSYLPFKQKTIENTSSTDDVCSCNEKKKSGFTGGVDEEMTIHRELNMQMRDAIKNEDFEKAARLRDRIKGLSVTQ